MKSLASDNYSGVCPEVWEALNKANHQHAIAYGGDTFTEHAVTLLKKTFGQTIAAYFVYNGTAANTLAFKAITRSHQAIICTDIAHLITNETGAVSNATGCAIITVPAIQGKLTPPLIEEAYKRSTAAGIHASQPRVVSISQPTEFGTVYTLDEISAISDMCKKYQLLLHVDGSRLANAAVALRVSLQELTADVGVDVLSFGGTKNGLLCGEALIFINPDLATDFSYIQKQSLQLHSKMRFLSAQFIPYLEDHVWHKNALHANTMCQHLAHGLANRTDIEFAYPIQTNQIFAYFPTKLLQETQPIIPYIVWDTTSNLVRLVTSFDTTQDDISLLINIALAG